MKFKLKRVLCRGIEINKYQRWLSPPSFNSTALAEAFSTQKLMQIQFTIQKFVTFVCINFVRVAKPNWHRATNSGDDFLVDALTKLDIVVGLMLGAGLNNSPNFYFMLSYRNCSCESVCEWRTWKFQGFSKIKSQTKQNNEERQLKLWAKRRKISRKKSYLSATAMPTLAFGAATRQRKLKSHSIKIYHRLPSLPLLKALFTFVINMETCNFITLFFSHAYWCTFMKPCELWKLHFYEAQFAS
jgi:hypothetical protein